MAQNTFRDIVPPEDNKSKSIRDISRVRDPRGGKEPLKEYNNEISPTPPPGRGRNGFFTRYGIWIVAVVVFVIFVVAFSLVFAGSKVVITPKQKDITVSGQFSAFLEPETGQLPYEIMKLKESATKAVKASGKRRVEERASGKIMIFNDFSAKTQRLVTNTRFETPEGLVYRIHDPIEVPGQRKSSNGELLPGSIEVVVFADEPGEKYNIDLTDFTIPGFKGSPQYKKFFARSKTAMSGGFVGNRPIVSDTTLADTASELRSNIEEKLKTQANADKPDTFYLFDGAIFFEWGKPEIVESEGSQALVKQSGILYGVLFPKQDFSQLIAKATIAGYDGESVRLDSIKGISLSVSPDPESLPWQENLFTFNLEGSARIIWVFDEEQLKDDLAGRPRAALPTILEGYPGVDKAKAVLRPLWKQTFPVNPEKISVEIRLTE